MNVPLKGEKDYDIAPPYQPVKLVAGNMENINSRRIVGWCRFWKHRGVVTKDILKSHGCLEKHCFLLERYESYPFWQDYERKEQQRKALKETKKQARERERWEEEQVKKVEVLYRETVLREAVRLGHTDFELVRVRLEETQVVLLYVSNNTYNDWSKFFDIAREVGRVFGQKIILRHVKDKNDRYVTIDNWKEVCLK